MHRSQGQIHQEHRCGQSHIDCDRAHCQQGRVCCHSEHSRHPFPCVWCGGECETQGSCADVQHRDYCWHTNKADFAVKTNNADNAVTAVAQSADKTKVTLTLT